MDLVCFSIPVLIPVLCTPVHMPAPYLGHAGSGKFEYLVEHPFLCHYSYIQCLK